MELKNGPGHRPGPRYIMNKWQWILEEDLSQAFIKINAILSRPNNDFSGEALAYAIKRLLLSEVEPGGPYQSSDGKVGASANRQIDSFLAGYGVSLSALKPYRNNGRKIRTGPTVAKCSFEKAVASYMLTEVAKVEGQLSRQLSKSVKRILEAKMSSEIVMISSYISELLGIKIQHKVKMDLAMANVYVWIAYSIYDDFYDDEGTIEELPLANYCARKAYGLFMAACPSKRSKETVADAFLRMDTANLRELNECRAHVSSTSIEYALLPGYRRNTMLADRAYAHILGPLIVSGYQSSSTVEARKSLRESLESFLIARQLNDDIHDWQEDLANGHLSPVVCSLLRANGRRSGTFDIEALNTELEAYWWEKGLEKSCREALRYADKSLEYASSFRSTKNNGFLLLVTDLKEAMHASIQIHKRSKEFLETYSSIATNLPE